MAGDRSGDPHQDSIPEDRPDTGTDSPPAARDDAARADIERVAVARGEAIDDGLSPQQNRPPNSFSEDDPPDDTAGGSGAG